MKEYVIIGNGVAAAACIEGIRSTDTTAPITVVSEENHAVYCRPLISYYLENKTDLQKMNYRRESFYADNGCKVLYGKKALSIDPDKKTVALDDGRELSYTKLCVATGSSPVVPPTEGLETVKEKYSFLTLDDALALEKAVDKTKTVLVVGAGLIGLKCAEGLKDRAKNIVVCDLAPRVLSSILDDECAAPVQKHAEKAGLTFLLGNTVSKFDGNTAYMKNGEKVDFDVLVLAVGVRANVGLVKAAGGEVGRGIYVDMAMKTTLKDVYAAGDCTESYDISFGGRRVLALLPNAYLQGRTAGVNMAGGKTAFENAVPMNSIGLFGLHMATAGSYFNKDMGGSSYEYKTETGVKRLYVKDGYLSGFILLGDVDGAGIYNSLVRNKIPLSEIDFEAVCKTPQLAAFSVNYRTKVLGGEV